MDEGYCGVWLVGRNGSLRAVLSGDHFCKGEGEIADDIAADACERSMLTGISPMFLVPDPAVKVACGQDDEEFAHVMLGSVDFRGDKFAERVKKAVMSVLGGSVVSVPWGESMTDDEANRLFSEMRDKNGTNGNR